MPNAKARGVTAAPSSDLPTLIVRERPASWPKASHANFSCSGARHEAIIAGIHSQRTAGHLRAELVQADLGMEYTAKRCSFIFVLFAHRPIHGCMNVLFLILAAIRRPPDPCGLVRR